MSKYFTKSAFNLAVECPAKLFYYRNRKLASGNKNGYEDRFLHDNLLRALAEGGFQVGELAKIYRTPKGENKDDLEVISRDHLESLEDTNQRLKQKDVVIFEAAFSVDNLFIRADIVEKHADNLDLIEVKSKSFFSEKGLPFFTKTKKTISKEWEKYLYDVAFQTYVVRKSKPEMKVTPFLMLVDKSKVTTVEGLNQLFLIKRDKSDKPNIFLKKGITKKETGDEILEKIDVSEEVNFLLNDPEFEKQVESWAKAYLANQKIDPSVGSKCKSCQFRPKNAGDSGKWGFNECWAAHLEKDKSKHPIIDIWNFRGAEKAAVVQI